MIIMEAYDSFPNSIYLCASKSNTYNIRLPWEGFPDHQDTYS